ncbi:MAG: hypothetical protein IT307_07790, partial [Chloroflexi bacterium]|nr:hypothetical protein [Chloroflexota bacterium]
LVPGFFGGGLPLNFPLAQDETLFGMTLSADRFQLYYFALMTAVIGWASTLLLSRSKFGYGLVAIRENEEAAEVMGINTTVSKSLAYVLSAALAALGGAVIGYRLTNMTTEAEALFSMNNNLQMIIICLIGGVGTVWGPWIGAFLLFAFQEALRTIFSSNDFLQWQATIFSLLIVLVVLFLPNGVLYLFRRGGRSAWRRFFQTIRYEHV